MGSLFSANCVSAPVFYPCEPGVVVADQQRPGGTGVALPPSYPDALLSSPRMNTSAAPLVSLGGPKGLGKRGGRDLTLLNPVLAACEFLF